MKLNRMIIAALVLLTALAPVGCAPGAPAPNEPTRLEEPTPGEALQADAAEYARQFGVSQEEALRRISLQGEIGELGAALQRNEAETFAGLWIQHEPDFRLVVAFTKGGKRTMQPYLEGKSWADLVQVKTHRYSLRELEADQQQVIQAAEGLGIPISSGISVQENRVSVTVGNPELFQKELRAAGKGLPKTVEVVAIDPAHLTDTLRGGVETYQGPDGRTIYFPKQAPTNVYMEALLEGKLILDANGCLRVESGAGEARLVLWHSGFTLRVEGEAIKVLDGKGQVVGRTGEAIRMGGGEIPWVNIPGMPLEACPGPYWALGSIESLEAQAIPDIYIQPLQIRSPDGNEPAARGFFLSQSKPAPEKDVLIGQLTADHDGCLRVGGYAIIWPPGIWPREDEQPLRLVSVKGGIEITVAVLGEEVRLYGSERTSSDYRYFENKAQCNGPFWGVARIEPLISNEQ